VTADAVVAELNCYPVKSCRGISLERADIGRMGIRYDRQWMVADAEGRFVAQRGSPGEGIGIRSLGQVETALRDDKLVLHASGMPKLELPLAGRDGVRVGVRIWGSSVFAADQGRDAGDWFTEYLSREKVGRYRLVRMPDDGIRRASRGAGQLAFADGYPFMLLSTASLADLNRRMGVALPMNRFRPSMVLETAEPYLEDRMARISVNGVELHGTTRCVRCPIPTFDQLTGDRAKEPLRTLATYRRTSRGVVFGRNFNHVGAGSIAVGDPVHVLAWESADLEP
jgi:MOSC domain-containing protein